ncbi:MAG: riboflavin biosynthesis protein RibF [Oligoflexales bacterium]|nr:riboflavin biosynthesis protein RibF [Oligoflexales bacterium]
MKILNIYNNSIDIETLAEKNYVITIGNFDGCHIGHQKLINTALALGDQLNHKILLFTFDPNPKEFFAYNGEKELIFCKSQKIRVFTELGFDGIYFQKFDSDFIKTSHEIFYREFLLKNLKPSAIIVGENFRFGSKRIGSVDYLKNQTKLDSISLHTEPSVVFDGITISSSKIRELIKYNGDFFTVTKMLGRPFSLEGVIIPGDKLGRTIGFPTANLGETNQLIPKKGVYAGHVCYENSQNKPFPLMSLPPDAIPALINVGFRPTVSLKNDLRIEAHLLNMTLGPDALYGKKAIFYFEKFIREEALFESINHLRNQILIDIAEAKKFFINEKNRQEKLIPFPSI